MFCSSDDLDLDRGLGRQVGGQWALPDCRRLRGTTHRLGAWVRPGLCCGVWCSVVLWFDVVYVGVWCGVVCVVRSDVVYGVVLYFCFVWCGVWCGVLWCNVLWCIV